MFLYSLTTVKKRPGVLTRVHLGEMDPIKVKITSVEELKELGELSRVVIPSIPAQVLLQLKKAEVMDVLRDYPKIEVKGLPTRYDRSSYARAVSSEKGQQRCLEVLAQNPSFCFLPVNFILAEGALSNITDSNVLEAMFPDISSDLYSVLAIHPYVTDSILLRLVEEPNMQSVIMRRPDLTEAVQIYILEHPQGPHIYKTLARLSKSSTVLKALYALCPFGETPPVTFKGLNEKVLTELAANEDTPVEILRDLCLTDFNKMHQHLSKNKSLPTFLHRYLWWDPSLRETLRFNSDYLKDKSVLLYQYDIGLYVVYAILPIASSMDILSNPSVVFYKDCEGKWFFGDSHRRAYNRLVLASMDLLAQCYWNTFLNRKETFDEEEYYAGIVNLIDKLEKQGFVEARVPPS